ncbi:MAG: trigger factor family protein, partial [Synergistes sp.]|nr:trigger factor family protein [Synergistes sp.]
MKTEILKQEKNVMELSATYTAEEVAAAISVTYRKISSQANVPGFRKGKMPRKMMELYFPKPTVLAETLETLVSDGIDEMIDEYELDLIDTPEIKAEKLNEGEAYSFTVKFEM